MIAQRWLISVLMGGAAFGAALAGTALKAEPGSAGADGGDNNALFELWRLAAAEGPAVRARAARARSSALRVDALPAWYSPRIDADLGLSGASNGRDSEVGPLARLSARWLVWDFGRQAAERTSLAAARESAAAQSELEIVALQLALTRLYYRILYFSDRAADLQNQTSRHERLLRLLPPRIRIGTAAASDYEETRQRLDQLRIAREDLLRERAAALGALRTLLYGDPDAPGFTPPERSPDRNPASPGSRGPAFAQTPTARWLGARARESRARLAARERDLYAPRVEAEVYGGYGPRLDALRPTRPEAGANFGVRLPLISNYDRGALYEADVAELEAEQAQLEIERRAAENEFRQIQFQFQHAEAHLPALQRLAVSAERNLQSAYADFARGLRSPGDMLSALAWLGEQRAGAAELKQEWLLAGAALRLLSDLAPRDETQDGASHLPNSTEQTIEKEHTHESE